MSNYDPLNPVIIATMLAGPAAALNKPWLLVAWGDYAHNRKPKPDSSRHSWQDAWHTIENYHVRGFDHEDDAVAAKLSMSVQVKLIANEPAQIRLQEHRRIASENQRLSKALSSAERRIARMMREVFGWQ